MSGGTEPSDATLVRRFRNGEQDAATELYLRYSQRLGQFARRQTGADLLAKIDAESIVQSVFRSFFRRAQDGQYEVARGEELWNLFLVIALNKVRGQATYHHAQRRDSRRTRSIADDAGITHPQAGDGNAYDVLRLTIDDLLNELPTDGQAMVMLRIEGFEVEEIACRTQRSKRSVERILQKFRERLGQIVFEQHADKESP